MLAFGLLNIGFIVFRYVLCIPALSKTFIMMGYWILSEIFFSIKCDDHVGPSIEPRRDVQSGLLGGF